MEKGEHCWNFISASGAILVSEGHDHSKEKQRKRDGSGLAIKRELSKSLTCQ